VLCCVVLCCAVLCCVVLCCAVLCCAVLCCAVLCCVVLCCVVFCCVVLQTQLFSLQAGKQSTNGITGRYTRSPRQISTRVSAYLMIIPNYYQVFKLLSVLPDQLRLPQTDGHTNKCCYYTASPAACYN